MAMETKRSSSFAENCEPFIHLEDHTMNKLPPKKKILKIKILPAAEVLSWFELVWKCLNIWNTSSMCHLWLWFSGWPLPQRYTQRHVHHLFWVTPHFLVGFCSPGFPHCLQAVLLLTCWLTKPLCSSGALWQSTSENRDAATGCLHGHSAVPSACYPSRPCETATNKIIINPILLRTTRHLSKCHRCPSNVIILRLI